MLPQFWQCHAEKIEALWTVDDFGLVLQQQLIDGGQFGRQNFGPVSRIFRGEGLVWRILASRDWR